MGISIYIIMFASLFGKEEKFEGYINQSRWQSQWPTSIYAIGQYENDLMTGPWSFYTDSTKTVKIAFGSFMNGNGSKISDTGIPYNGRHGEWKHYYSDKNNRNRRPFIKNSIKAYQNWKNGKMDGEVITYFLDGKKSATSYYKDGKRDGIRKEWFAGGFQGTNLYRISKFNNGKQISDKINTFGGRKLFTSTYKNSSVVDSIFQSRKGYETKIFIAKSNNRMTMFHENGKIYNDIIVNKNGSGTMKAYYDNGQLMIEEKFDSTGSRYWRNDNRICYNPEGKIIDSIKFKDGNIHGEVIELMTSKTIINSNFRKIFSLYVHYNYQPSNNYRNRMEYGSVYYRSDSISPVEFLPNDSQQFSNYKGYNKGIFRKIISCYNPIGPFYLDRDKHPINSFRLNYREGTVKMKGARIETLTESIFNKFNYCVGYGTYNNGIRIGKWYWEDKNGNKILEGKFNNEGNPVDLWENYGIDEVLTFSDDGLLIGTMKTRIKD